MKKWYLTGHVDAVLIGDNPRSSATETIQKITAIRGVGIAHTKYARPRISDVREKEKYGIEKGNEIFNWREFSAISPEDLEEIRQNLGLPCPVPLGCLGENLVISGLSEQLQAAGLNRFSDLPPGTMLQFNDPTGNPRTTMLAVWSQNNPCVIPGENLQEAFPAVPNLRSRFPKAAMNKRGVVGFVFRSGFIKQGDSVRVLLP